MTKPFIPTLLMTATCLALGCGSGPTDSSDGGLHSRDGTVRVVMHTPPPEELASPDVAKPDEVWIRFDRLDAHEIHEGWISIDPRNDVESDNEVHFGAMPLVLAEGDLPAGAYDQLRLLVRDASIYVEGVLYPLEIPSGETSGFKIHGQFCIDDDDADDGATDPDRDRANPDGDDEDEATEADEELHLYWDTQEGIRYSDPRGYWLVPSVQLEGTPGCDDDGYDDDEYDDDGYDDEYDDDDGSTTTAGDAGGE